MIDRTPDWQETVDAGGKTRHAHYAVLGAVCALVIGIYVWSAKSGWVESWSLNAENTYYNLQVRGFRAGQLNLKREVPSGLAQLPDPYDRKAMIPHLLIKYPLLDLSYYQNKFYLYFGVTPALALFWPYVALTGHYLLHRDAAVILFSMGFLASACLLWAVWRRYFAQVSVGAVAAVTLALGMVNFAPVILQRCDVYEVAISCGQALTMVTLLLLWQTMHAPRWRVWWLAGASLTYGLALGARPSLLLGAVILLVPVAMIWREAKAKGQCSAFRVPRSAFWQLLLAATVPITAIGLGLMCYNYLRFDHPLEFGSTYQLTEDRVSAVEQFSLRYFWFNVWVGYLAPAQWSSYFPFVRDIAMPPLPKGGIAEQLPFGMLTNIPLVWLAVFAMLAWRGRGAEARSTLRGFVAAVALLFGSCALTLIFHNSMCLRYQLEFACPLVWLAVVGVLGLERELADRPFWRRATRCGWGLLLIYSVMFNLLAMVERTAESYVFLGRFYTQQRQPEQAILEFQRALKFQPDNAVARSSLGAALLQKGRAAEAIAHLELALQLKPDFAEAHDNLGIALSQVGRLPEAIAHLEEALRLKPDYAAAHNDLGVVLYRQGRVSETIEHWEQALRLHPGNAAAHNNLGEVLLQQGRIEEAVGHYEQARRLEPDQAARHFNLANALLRLGRLAEAVDCYQQAVRLKPVDAEACHKLAWILATETNAAIRNVAEAVRWAERACELTTNQVALHLDALGVAYSEAGRFDDAVRKAQGALELAKAAGQTEQARRIEERLQMYRAGRAYHEGSKAAP